MLQYLKKLVSIMKIDITINITIFKGNEIRKTIYTKDEAMRFRT